MAPMSPSPRVLETCSTSTQRQWLAVLRLDERCGGLRVEREAQTHLKTCLEGTPLRALSSRAVPRLFFLAMFQGGFLFNDS